MNTKCRMFRYLKDISRYGIMDVTEIKEAICIVWRMQRGTIKKCVQPCTDGLILTQDVNKAGLWGRREPAFSML